jgi:uncharacterized membrane protein
MTKLSQSIVYTIIFLFNLAALSLSAQAAMIGTEAVLAAQNRQAAEDKVQLALARDDVSSQLQKMGVNPDDARQRVAALSDQELENLSHRLDRLPAGGDFFGTVGLIFIILIITDLLGFTKIFPFTRAQR